MLTRMDGPESQKWNLGLPCEIFEISSFRIFESRSLGFQESRNSMPLHSWRESELSSNEVCIQVAFCKVSSTLLPEIQLQKGVYMHAWKSKRQKAFAWIIMNLVITPTEKSPIAAIYIHQQTCFLPPQIAFVDARKRRQPHHHCVSLKSSTSGPSSRRHRGSRDCNVD